MRILCVTEDLPWPPTSGYRVRLSNVVPTLTSLGTVDHFVPLRFERDPALPDRAHDSQVARLRVVPNRDPRSNASRMFRWGLGLQPRDVLLRSWARARAEFASWVEPPYDLVWFGHLDTYLGVGDLVDASAIVDLDNLWDRWLRHRRGAVRAGGSRPGAPSALRSRLAHLADIVDEQKYDRLHHRLARRVGAVLVCSAHDRARLGVPNAVVVPNAYPIPDPPARLRTPNPAAPRLLMTGSLRYLPNEDGVRWFVEEILPLVRAELPGAALRLVGEHAGLFGDIAATAGVDLAGPVDDMRTELDQADVVVAPLRYGGGTRVKIIEAFAHRVPVVSTTVGCEGLDVTPGTQVLVADDPAAFASACVRAVGDEQLRASMTTAAEEVYRTRYSSDVVRGIIADVARQVGTSSS